MKMLIVDDDQYIVTLVAAIMKKNKAEFVSHNNVGDALRNLMEEEFDAMLIDLHMPGIDGLTAIPLAKEIRPGINVGMMTGDTNPEVKARALIVGADYFVQKPEDIKNLWELLKNSIDKES